jgi:ATP-dependent Lon protease
VVTPENLDEFIGTAVFQSKRFYKHMPPGVVVGLAYNSYGGSILYIESQRANSQNYCGGE